MPFDRLDVQIPSRGTASFVLVLARLDRHRAFASHLAISPAV